MPATAHSIVGRTTAQRGALALALAAAALLFSPLATKAAITPAGVSIDNIARLSFTIGGELTTTSSNQVSLEVAELLDVEVEAITELLSVDPSAKDHRLAFRVRNLGNSGQAFDLQIDNESGDFDPQACRLIVDWDRDGVLDMTRDRVSSITPELAPGESVMAWVSCDIPSNADGFGRIMLRAYPSVLRDGSAIGMFRVLGRNLRLGSGGKGPGAVASYRAGTPPTTSPGEPQLIKTQAVRDSAGGTRVLGGSIVTYSLAASFPDGLNVSDARISDPIPAGSTYVEGSLTLDGARLTDGEDADAGRFAGGSIEVALGAIAAKASHLVTFQVRINRSID